MIPCLVMLVRNDIKLLQLRRGTVYVYRLPTAFSYFNRHGRHVLHQLAEDFRHPRIVFSKSFWWEAQWATSQLLRDGLNVRTCQHVQVLVHTDREDLLVVRLGG